MTNRQTKRFRAFVVGLIIVAQPATSILQAEDTNTVDLIRQLQRRIEELEHKVKILEHDKGPDESASDAKGKERIEDLDQKVKVLERNHELDQEAAEARAKQAPTISLGENGFLFGSANGDFALRLGGLLQVDSRTFFDNSENAGNSGLLLRRARIYLQGTVFRYFDFMFVPDFAPSSGPTILDAFVNYRYSPGLQLQAGKFKVPIGLEQLVADRSILFNERTMATDLVPNRDIGVQLHGDFLDRSVSYAAGFFNGTSDGGNSGNANYGDAAAVAGRLFLQPLVKSSEAGLKGVGFGLAGSYESLGTPGAAGLPSTTGGSLPGYYTDGQQQFFAYNPADKAIVVAKGEHWRLSPQAYYYFGPFGLMGEYVISDQQVAHAGLGSMASARLQNTAWEVTGSWLITGEDASYGGIVAPRRPFNPGNGDWGALQLVSRYMELAIDPAAFPQFSDPRTSANSANAWSIGINWYLNHNLRFELSFSHTLFRGGGGAGRTAPATVTRKDENVLFTRAQLAF